MLKSISNFIVFCKHPSNQKVEQPLISHFQWKVVFIINCESELQITEGIPLALDVHRAKKFSQPLLICSPLLLSCSSVNELNVCETCDPGTNLQRTNASHSAAVAAMTNFCRHHQMKQTFCGIISLSKIFCTMIKHIFLCSTNILCLGFWVKREKSVSNNDKLL